ncbi:50S ribosomal protein L20 [Buchnera aphidicola (Anoecia corni)]|uniref:Large ribosomal subunit protein bL20 n=1 Tax=Buchnera aphidicola (Anoecia corni) TaxID=2994477 RepID=A0AAT9IG87_9GAMM
MVHVKRGTTSSARHKKILKKAKGYYGARSKVYRVANQAVIKAGQYSYRDRRQKKRQFRKLWIVRINAAVRNNNISYNKFIFGLKNSGLNLNRKMLSEISINDPLTFKKIVNQSQTIIS